MPEMISYIFGSLRNSEEAIKNINKTLKAQNKINKTVVAFSLATVTYMVIADIQYREQQAKIDALTKEVKALKRDKKGE